ncbi:hypothetical protein A1OO_03205 [Enterovibrio norvegicus FF-33]|uniref:Uncharacterized protein n=1 Tax=Enterovibrio norvegicus FF-454 TaxID=1185651 RepID=A0A1E5C3A4_9GAMM|nr:hypothetical protein [Enterovibrio norvegicus]OEE59961.1 hypothetical protein A1OK_12795 [Enterovibrio norvegicus FF-454]OEE69803.1 hypothetical protein A1OO_03205 [Enterovibrio norvegicus FF-33]
MSSEYFNIMSQVISWYMLLWITPCLIAGIVLAFGDSSRIKWIDNQLAKDSDKLSKDDQSALPFKVIPRFMDYCIAFLFIQNRRTSNSPRFRAAMWYLSVGRWLFFVILAYSMFN